MLRVIHCFTIFYVIVLTLLLELPSIPPEVSPVDESVRGYAHLITFTLLGFLVELGRCKRTMLFWLGILILYAFGTEFLQLLLHPICHRFFDWEDIVQNVLGVFLGTFIGHFCRPLVKRLDKTESQS